MITQNNFNDNWRGIYLKGLTVPDVSDNVFDVGQIVALPINNNTVSYGLYLDNSTGYKVENNIFNTTHNGYLGVYVNNSGTASNEIYRNTFNNLTVASQAAQINGDASSLYTQKGLVFRCNQYNSTSNYDILVSSGIIKNFEGTCIPNNLQSPANNQFSYTAIGGDYWLNNNVFNFSTYEYSPGGNSSNLPPRTINTGFTSDYINISNTAEQSCTNQPPFDYNKSCPLRKRRIIGNNPDPCVIDPSTCRAIDSLKALIDGGSTANLLNLVATTSGGKLKNTLMNASPYLSDTVLIAYILSNPPNGHLQQILTVNSPLSQAVLDVLDNISLPKGIKNLIDNTQTGTSAMQELQANIAYQEAVLSRDKNDILRFLLFDTTDSTASNYKNVVDYLNGIAVKTAAEQKLLINSLMANSSLSDAQTKLATITADSTNTNFKTLNTTVTRAMQDSTQLKSIVTDSTMQQVVRTVASSTQKQQSVACAQSLLQCLGLKTYTDSIEIVLPQNGMRWMNPNNKQDNAQASTKINIYPNPAKEQFTLVQNLDVNQGLITLKVFDIMGKALLHKTITKNTTQIDVKNIKSVIDFFGFFSGFNFSFKNYFF